MYCESLVLTEISVNLTLRISSVKEGHLPEVLQMLGVAAAAWATGNEQNCRLKTKHKHFYYMYERRIFYFMRGVLGGQH